MSPNELKGVIGALVGALAYFLVREFTRKDKIAADLETFRAAMDATIKNLTEKFATEISLVADRNTKAIDSLKDAVGELAISVADQKVWFTERYVFATDHEKDIQTLKGDIERHADRFEKELEKHAKNCPAMRS